MIKKSILIQSYNRSAAVYDDQFKKIQFTKYKLILSSLILSDFHTFLDLGCGTGLLYDYISDQKEIKKRFPVQHKYYGIDFSTEMLKAAKRKGIANVTTGLIHSLPFPDNFFNALFSFTVIGLSDDPPRTVFKECYRVLCPGGTLALTILKKLYDKYLRQALEQSGFRITLEIPDCGQDCGIIAEK